MKEDSSAHVQSQDRQTRRVQHWWPLVSGLIALALVLVGGALIAVRQFDVVPYEVDQEWMDELLEYRIAPLETVALFFDATGGGVIGVFVIPIVVAGLLAVARRFWAVFYFLAASIASALMVQVVKNLVGRPRPEDILVTADFGSFPSGHTANAATLAVVLGVILHRWWVWGIGALWVFLMLLSRNYLGAHWLTDTVGGLVLGVAVALIVWAPFANRLYREHLQRKGVLDRTHQVPAGRG